MKRKVIKQANQAYTITLPIDWVRENNLNKDSEIDLNISGRSLVINSDKPLVGKRISINSSELSNRNIYLHMAAAYAQGVDEIELISKEDISSIITKSMNNLIGYALVSQDMNKFVIKDINPGNYDKLDEIFKRVFQMILLFYEASIKDVFGKKNETLESLKARDNEVNKFCLFLQRAINKMTYEDQVKGRIVFTYSFALEKIGDEIERLWRVSVKNKLKLNKDIKRLIELSKEGLGKSFELYYQFNSKKIEEIYSLRDKVRKDSMKMINLDANTLRFVRHIVKIIEEAADLNHLALMKRL